MKRSNRVGAITIAETRKLRQQCQLPLDKERSLCLDLYSWSLLKPSSCWPTTAVQ